MGPGMGPGPRRIASKSRYTTMETVPRLVQMRCERRFERYSRPVSATFLNQYALAFGMRCCVSKST